MENKQFALKMILANLDNLGETIASNFLATLNIGWDVPEWDTQTHEFTNKFMVDNNLNKRDGIIAIIKQNLV